MNQPIHACIGDSTFSRRKAAQIMGATAIAGVGMARAGVGSTDGVEREYEGESSAGNLQQALDAALAKVDADLAEGGVSDGMANWRLCAVTGLRGGVAGLNTVKVRIAASRTPPYPGKSTP